MKLYSQKEARHLLCRYHNLDGAETLCQKAGAEKIMQRIHSIQYDPLNVVARNADLVLQARVKDYKEQDLYHLLYKEHKLIDGFDKEMCIYDARDFMPFKYVRNEHLKHVLLTLQYRNQMAALDILDDVRDFVAKHGKTGAKDISIGEVRESRWGPKKLSSAALDYLFNSGELSVADKRGTQKYFDLTERVLEEADLHCSQDMTIEEFLEWYIERRIQSVGLLWNKSGGAWQGHFVSENEIRSSTLQTLIGKDRIDAIQIEGIPETFYVPKDIQTYMKYQVPQSYARFIARFEAEPVRHAGEFVIKNWWWETGIVPNHDMLETIEKEMVRFAEFLQVGNSKNNAWLFISSGLSIDSP
ncbi:MAG: winged helix DNA-binding domain-containing protein [Lachnospiraceae bacterium]|nr:winged helix DNA-binding domain-containing protein [Lachnospiraceae bacterium]